MLKVVILFPDSVEPETLVIRDIETAERIGRLRKLGAKILRAEVIRRERIGPAGFRTASPHLRRG